MNLNDILDKALRSFLATSFVFGTLQFVTISVITLFGTYLDWRQYIASVVLLGVGLVGLRSLLNIVGSDSEEKS